MLNIVIIDDEKEILILLNRVLLKNNFNVVLFDNPIKAIDYININNQGIDIVLTDLLMPQMNGDKLIDILKNKYPKKRYIIMSGARCNKTKSKYDVIDKPFESLTYFVNKLKQ